MQRSIQSGDARKRRHHGEQGYMLLAVVVMVALVLIALAVAAPVVARELRRDKEVESEHRAEQYVRALRMYYKKTQTYPGSMEALEKSNNVRYLRKQYVDPLTGKPDWRIIHVGENQTTVKGFFGEPLGGLDTKGIGANLGSAAGIASNGPTNALASGFSASNSGSNASGSSGSGSNGPSGNSPSSNSPGSSGPYGSSGGIGSGTGAGTGTGTGSGIGSGIGGTGSTASSGFGSGGVGQIMGVGTSRSGTSILNPNQQTTYETWEFLYDPRIELLYAKSNILGGGIGSQSATSFGSDATNGKSNSGNGTNGMQGFPGTNSSGTNSSGPGSGTSGTSGTSGSSGSSPQYPQ